MGIPFELTSLQTFAWLLSAVFVFALIKHLNLNQLRSDKKVQHLIFGCSTSLLVLWLFRTGIHDGLSVHFLWLSALPLILGFRWAVVSASLALIGITLAGLDTWNMLGVNFLLGILLPISFSYGLFSVVFHHLPRNVFIYIFLCAFIPGALTIGLKMLALSGYFYLDGLYDWQTIMDNYLVLTMLLAFPEAMFNGMTITILVIHKPEWVYTFHDKFYLR